MRNINDFNEETQLIIKQFIQDLFIVLPNLNNKISKKKIEEVILNNLEHNIEFDAELEKRVNGKYSINEKKIYISRKISKDEKQKRLTTFHELIHVVTAAIYTDELIKDNPYITEVLTTLLEERYNEKLVKKQTLHNRVNGYIPDFGRQLLLVYGDKLLEQFIVEPLNIHEIFNGFSENIKKFLYNKVVRGLNLLNRQIKSMVEDVNVKSTVEELEKNIADQLFYKVNSSNINENFELIQDVFASQYYPNVSTYSSMLYRVGDYSKLDGYPILQTLKLINETDNKEKLIQLFRKVPASNFPIKQIRGIIMQKLFGYTCDDITEIAPDTFEFLQNEDIYSTIFNKIIEDDISVNEIDKLGFRRCRNSNSKFANRLTFDIESEILGYNSSVPLFVLVDTDDSIISIFNEYELENIKHETNDIEKIITQPEISSKITSYLNFVTEKTQISEFYWEETVQDLEEEWKYWDFEIYYRNVESELTQIMITFDENKELIFQNIIIPMSESKSLIAKTDTVNLGTNCK